MTAHASSWSRNDILNAATERAVAGDGAAALDLYETALAQDPNNAQALFNLGSLALQFDQPLRAIKHLRQAIRCNRNVADYHLLLSGALATSGKYEEAISAARQTLKLRPRSPDALCYLGGALAKLGQIEEAVPHIRRAIEMNPNSPAAHQSLGHVLLMQGNINEAIDAYRTAMLRDPQAADSYLGLAKCLAFLPSADPSLITEATRRWAALQNRPPLKPFANDLSPDRRLRIGYVSGDFIGHPVAFFMENVLRCHDGASFETFCYANQHKEDDATARLKSVADHWRTVHGLENAAVEELIRGDRIDILVDLSGHTNRNRLKVFLAKPAPVQCTWLGYYATTGLPGMDYIIADRYVVPVGAEALYTEKPWRLPDSYLCFTPPDPDVPGGPLPMRRDGTVTFGSCNNVLKINMAVMAVWSRILAAVPGSRLVLRSHALSNDKVRAALTGQFAAAGLPPDRLILLPAGSRYDTLATYNAIDIALDPFPYGGGTTTVEALWMGVPVVSLRGDRFTGRVSESILTTAGLADLVLDDEASYIAKAVAMAGDPADLERRRATLRGQLAQSPLCDAKRFTANLEAGYREMWRIWCAGRRNAA